MRLIKPHPLILAAALWSISAFTPAFAAPFDQIETADTAPLAGFQKVYIAPVQVTLDDVRVRRSIRDINNDRPVSDRDKARKAEDSHEDMVRAFGQKFEIVDTPGSDVLTVETIVTKLSSTRPTLADYDVAVSLDFNSIYAGGATFDVRLSQGDTVLAEISDSYTSSFNDGRPRIAVWQDYDRVSAQFARKLARYIRKN